MTVGQAELPSASRDSGAVALYIDFENLHAGVHDLVHGPGSYDQARYNRFDELVNVSAVVAFARTLGFLAVNKAYGNWQRASRYKDQLTRNAVDLVQMYPVSGTKNGADIRLALDALEDTLTLRHVDTVVIAGGDSDYIPLAAKLRRIGCRVVGVGVRQSSSKRWGDACDMFLYYGDLTDRAATPTSQSDALPAALTAVLAGAAGPDGWVLKSRVGHDLAAAGTPLSAFAETHGSFDAFVDAHPQFERRVGDYDHEYRLAGETLRPSLPGAGAALLANAARRAKFHGLSYTDIEACCAEAARLAAEHRVFDGTPAAANHIAAASGVIRSHVRRFLAQAFYAEGIFDHDEDGVRFCAVTADDAFDAFVRSAAGYFASALGPDNVSEVSSDDVWHAVCGDGGTHERRQAFQPVWAAVANEAAAAG